METKLNLIKTEFKEVEKKILPRFPFTYLMFKDAKKGENRVYEVNDISHTGMQLSLKNGEHRYRLGDEIDGVLQWKKASIGISGSVKWVGESKLGLKFHDEKNFTSEMREFLSVDNIIAGMLPLHENSVGIEIPSNLKYWPSADGPVDIFVWQHSDGELERLQVILFENFIEWKDGKGVRTGRVVTKRDLDTPLMTEDEFVFQIDDGVVMERIAYAKEVIKRLPEALLPSEVSEFLVGKLGG